MNFKESRVRKEVQEISPKTKRLNIMSMNR